MPQSTPASPSFAAARYVFVYGTLRKGDYNDINALRPAPQFVGHSQTFGTLYHLGSYPGLILGGDQPVVGEVYAINAVLEPMLDEIEHLYPVPTDEYVKRTITVQVAGVSLKCLVYEINPSYTVGKPILAGGDWMCERKL